MYTHWMETIYLSLCAQVAMGPFFMKSPVSYLWYIYSKVVIFKCSITFLHGSIFPPLSITKSICLSISYKSIVNCEHWPLYTSKSLLCEETALTLSNFAKYTKYTLGLMYGLTVHWNKLLAPSIMSLANLAPSIQLVGAASTIYWGFQ